MTYAVKDVSIQSGAPIYCYQFVSDFVTWRYTSYNDPVTLGGNVYEPLQISHSAVEINDKLDTNASVDIKIPSRNDIAIAFAYIPSPRELKVTIFRAHEGDNLATDYKIEWAGYFVGAKAEGKYATIQTASIISSALNGNLATVYYQKICNHTLFDDRCQVNKASFTDSATITKIQGQLLTIDVSPYSNDEMEAGTIVNTRTGEQQGIIGNTGLQIRIGYPFYDLIIGDVMDITLGCDHLRLGHCKNRFNNVIHYGGMDFIPEVNPFEKLRLETTVNTTNTLRKISLGTAGQWDD